MTRIPNGMRLYSYIVKHDTGFAPNPFWGYCTLANCKPAIRRTARIGDWIVGLSPKSEGNRLVFAMKVRLVLSYKEYFVNRAFHHKKPDFSSDLALHKVGDNIYQPLPNGRFRQLRSMHSKPQCGAQDPKSRMHDLSGRNVLASKEFVYFGRKAVPLPRELSKLKVQRAHRCNFSDAFISRFVSCIEMYRRGVHAAPTIWPANDIFWRKRKARETL